MKTKITASRFLPILFLLFFRPLAAQIPTDMHLPKLLDSGGPLIREQAAYDVLFYRLNVSIDTTTRSITSRTYVRALALDTLSSFVLDLSSNFTVDSVVWQGRQVYNSTLKFSRSAGRIWITLPSVVQKSDTIALTVAYHGVPKVSTNPPWDDGFVWKRTKTGEVWAGVACQLEGADVWWPCKDQPSDEPDSVDLYFTVPGSLTCVSNGRLLGTIELGGLRTFHWYVSQPINNYLITFYLGPFQRVPVAYESVTHESIPSEYWFLPQSLNRLQSYKDTLLKDLRFLEETCGPFPFRAEKYSIVEAPYWGMEHQTAIAYGNNFAFRASDGFDYIHLHELAHEWWGNLVTARDWSDMWIHEGFASYMEALFVERSYGFARYKTFMAGKRTGIRNLSPVAPTEPTSIQSIYSGHDIYSKGAWILHTLRYWIGDQPFFTLLRRFAYPDPAMEGLTNGKQCRLATTEEFRQMAEQISGKTLDWFFTVYLRQSGLPILAVGRKDTTFTIRWIVFNNITFPMPVDVQVGSNRITVNMTSGVGTFSAPIGMNPVIDPDAKILMAPPMTVSVDDQADLLPSDFAVSVYPNPFNPNTTLLLQVPKRMQVRGEIFSLSGERIGEVVNSWLDAGTHSVSIDLGNQSSGIYFVVIRSEGRTLTTKVVLMK